MFLLILIPAVFSVAVAQDRVVFDANIYDTGAPRDTTHALVPSWPIRTRIDQHGKTLTIYWPGDNPPEVMPLGSVTHLERARPYEDKPDELFAVIESGRRILLCQGETTATLSRLASAMVSQEIVSLPMGEGHATRPPSNPASPTLDLATGSTALSGGTLGAATIVSPGPQVTGEREGASVARAGADAVEKRTVDQVIKDHMPLFRQCYEVALREQPGLVGKVTVGFVIVGTGAVGAATIQASTMDNKVVESCVRAKVMAIRFPAPSGNTTVQVSYPFVFSSN